MGKIYNFPRLNKAEAPAQDKRIRLSLKALAKLNSLLERPNEAEKSASFPEAEAIREAALSLQTNIENMIELGRFDQAEVNGILTDALRLLSDIAVRKTKLKAESGECA